MQSTLDAQERDGIIERVSGSEPTPWISNLVVVPKGQPRKSTQRALQLVPSKPRLVPEARGTSWRPHVGHTLEPCKLEVRLTCDSKALNKAIKRTRYPCKTIDDIIYMVNGATIFSKLDIVKAFHQLQLAKESRHLTTIVTHKGLYRYKRLHMGISCASEIFTEAIRVILAGIPNQLNMTDDVLVYGRTQEEHDAALQLVLDTLE